MNASSIPRTYPRRSSLGNADIDIDLLGADDGPDIARLIQQLPTHDLLFVSRDLGHPKVVSAWLDALADDRVTSLAARCDGELVGCTAVVTDPRSWSRHVAELRVMVSPAWRGRGLGRLLIQECFALALGLGLEKLYVRMTVDQRSAIAVFEELGFRAEAVLRDHVKDHDGSPHDLAILSHHVAKVQARLEACGVADALGS